MTNRQKIELLPVEKFAEYLITTTQFAEDNEHDWDDDNAVYYETFYVTPNGERCYWYEDALERTIQWLKEEVDG